MSIYTFIHFFTYLVACSNFADGMENLTAITWSHATNTQELLTTVLNSEINFIEADIVFGYLIDGSTEERQPVMAHPPIEFSDISLRSFLTQVLSFNKENPKEKQKGVKLDFKSTSVYQNSLNLLIELWGLMDYPVWINADIYGGPLNNILTTPVDAQIFFEGCKSLSNATLSTGWTTRWGSNFTDGYYTNEQVNLMIDGIQKNNILNPVTFPVRAGIAGQSIDQLERLYDSLKDARPVTFTIWSSENDAVDVEQLRKMIFHFGFDKIYLDVPESLSRRLRLDAINNSSLKNPNLVVLGLVLLTIIFSFF